MNLLPSRRSIEVAPDPKREGRYVPPARFININPELPAKHHEVLFLDYRHFFVRSWLRSLRLRSGLVAQRA